MQMRDTPPLRDVEAKAFRKICRRSLRHRVAPCTERHEQVSRRVKREVSVHHGRKAKALETPNLHPILFQNRSRKVFVAFLNAVPDVVEVIRPHAVLQPVFPIEAAGGKGRAVRPDEHRLDACRTEFETEYGLAGFNPRADLLLIHIFSVLSVPRWFDLLPFASTCTHNLIYYTG